jgi:aryl-alcohol dehydrogenase-like predicted oxidoreductase
MLPTAMTDFTHRHLAAVNKRVHRLGLACNYGIDEKGLSAALERGINYIYWSRARTGHLLPTLQAALAKDRERTVIAAATTFGFFGFNVRAACERALKALRTDYVDVLILSWLGTTAAYTEATVEAMNALKAEGKVRAFGTSIHDRPRAGRLAEDSAIELFMLRYNAAHPGAERDVFPHLGKRQPAVVAYTATSWRKLLKKPRGWDGAPMTAGDCYRFCLSSPHVDVTLCGPANEAQLTENLAAVEKGPLSADEDAWMRRFGEAVHG